MKMTLQRWTVALQLGGLVVAGAATAQDQTAALEPLVLNWQDADWGPPSNQPRFPAGLRNAPIATDPATGGPTYLARFPAGSEFEMHWHTHTETVVILDGAVDIVMEGVRHTATEGSYVIIPGKAHHTWIVPADADVVLLARRDGPADFHFVER